jgi:hypothetical protein
MVDGKHDATDKQRDGDTVWRFFFLIIDLLRADIGGVARHLFLPAVRRLANKPDGIYEVLDYEARLELLDAEGSKARFTKRQRVRFLQDNVIAYQDQAWGDGEFLVNYRCSPGVAADQYREGHKYRILISLRETKNRGDVAEFFIERTIKQGFTKSVEDFQIDIDHFTKHLKLVIVFPLERLPKQVKLLQQHGRRTKTLEAEARHVLPDGRQQVVWETRHLKLHEAYVVRWEW